MRPTSVVPTSSRETSAGARIRRRHLTTLRLIREGRFRAPPAYPTLGTPVATALDVYLRMAPYAARELTEAFWVLALDARRRVVDEFPHVVSRGVLDGAVVHPREVFVGAILRQAAAVVLVHNHPSGDPAPSPEDRAITAQLVATGAVLAIPVRDHVIIGAWRYFSFREAGGL